MRRHKEGLWRVLLAVFATGCIWLAGWEDVRAEKAASPELAELLGFDTCYDCGSKTEDGVLEFRSDTHSLKAGDIVEMQVIYHADRDTVTGGLSIWDFYVTHDVDVLEYLDVNVKDEYKIKYMPQITDMPCGDEDSTYEISGFFSQKRAEGFQENDCLFTLRYKVKKSVPITQFYVDTVEYGNADSNKSVRLYEYNGTYVNASDIFTVEIEDTNSSDSSLALASAPVQGNGEVVVSINLKQNSGFNLLGLTIHYEDSLFSYEALEIDDTLKSKISLDSVYAAPGSGEIKASFIALEDITDTGNFLNLKLKVKDGVPVGTTSNVGVDITQVGNKEETSISGTGTSCAVTVTGGGGGEEIPSALGDVNGDKNIDLIDAVYILQNYNQVREFTDAQKTAADVDKNGEVNLVDALRIMKYFNGEITGF